MTRNRHAAAAHAAQTTPKAGRKRFARLRRQREGGWLPLVWHGMRLGAWLRLLWRGRFDVTLNCLPGIVTVTAVAPVNSGLSLLSEAIWRRRAEALRLEDHAPVFILGHWRTGTTLLHDLLACDPRLAAPSTYECVFPGHFLLSERAFGRALKPFLPRRRPQDAVPVGPERPQEDEFALANLGLGTPYATLAWPRHGPAGMAYLDLEDLSDEERRAWAQGMLWFYRRLALKNGRTLVLKSPPHTARLKQLTALFPHARYVHIARDPMAVVPSTLRLWRALCDTQGLHNPARVEPWLEAHVIDTFARLHQRYEATRGLVPAGRLVEIRYEDLMADVEGTLGGIYATLGLGDFTPAEAPVAAYLAARGGHRVASYALPDALREAIADRLAPYMQRFGYGGGR